VASRQGWCPRAILALSCAGAIACAPRGPRLHPVASLADTTAAGQAFANIRFSWNRNLPAERPKLRRELDAFVQRFPHDGLTPLVRIYAALSLMDAPADWAEAERRLDALAPPPQGSALDLYVIAAAKLRRYHHQPDYALALLRPIVGNIVDARARALLQEELAFDALEAHAPYEAIAYMDAWLRGASEDERDASEAKVAVALGAVPEAALRGALEAMRNTHPGESHGYGVVIRRLLAERLGQIAVDRGDASLARWLLDPAAGDSLRPDESQGGLVQLATSKRGIGNVAGRTVGLVLPTSSSALRDEVADVLRGVLWALDIGRDHPEDPGARAPIRLVTRDDGGDPTRLRLGMEEVAGEGASVIITALDPPTAREALEWARSSSLPVIVLAAPKSPELPPAGFSVGEDWAAELAALGGTLGNDQGGPKTALLADTEAAESLLAVTASTEERWGAPISCDILPTHAGESRFPVGTWQKSGTSRWLVAGSAACAEDLLSSLARVQHHGTVALSLEASDARMAPSSGLHVSAATAGIVPLGFARPSDPRVVDARAMVARTGAPAGWWTALGHDAAILARAAVLPLPTDTVTDANEIARRRAFVLRGLTGAHAPLWTSERDGFGPSRTLPRTIRVAPLRP
jgi:hypothetical protein